MFLHMTPVKTAKHTARDTEYELLVYQAQETGEYHIYIAKGDFGVGDVFTASQEVVSDAASTSGMDVVEELISIAISDIDKNEFGYY
jgi:hypothetical protein